MRFTDRISIEVPETAIGDYRAESTTWRSIGSWPANVEAVTSTETVVDEDTQTQTALVQAPTQTPIDGRCRFRWAGACWSVVGPIKAAPDRLRGGTHHIEFSAVWSDA